MQNVHHYMYVSTYLFVTNISITHATLQTAEYKAIYSGKKLEKDATKKKKLTKDEQQCWDAAVADEFPDVERNSDIL